jgi:predicted DNA-binding protein
MRWHTIVVSPYGQQKLPVQLILIDSYNLCTQGIKLDNATQARLKALAIKRDRSPHWLMRTAIERYLAQEEQYEKEKAEDMAAYEE